MKKKIIEEEQDDFEVELEKFCAVVLYVGKKL